MISRPTTCHGVLALLLAVLAGSQAYAADGRLEIAVVDKETGKPIPCRMHLKNAAGRPRFPKKTVVWDDHFTFPGNTTLLLPPGNYSFEAQRGLEYLVARGYFTINNFADDSHQIELERFIDLAAEGWWSGDLDVRRAGASVPLLLEAEDLHMAQTVSWSNTQGQDLEKKPTPQAGVIPAGKGRFCHLTAGLERRPGGSLLYLNLPKPFPLGPADSEFPPPNVSTGRAREIGRPWIDTPRADWWDLPAWVANGDLDSVQVLGGDVCRAKILPAPPGARPHDPKRYPGTWGPAQWAQAVYFHLLNCGLRLPPTAGSASGASPNPVGYNRIYVQAPRPLTEEKWWEGLRAGRVVVTNGPLMIPSVNGQPPGHLFRAERGAELEFEIGLTLSIRDPEQQPISYLEIIENGEPLRSIRFSEYAKTGRLPKIRIQRSGWFLIRAVTDVRSTCRFAMTGPYFVEIGYQRAVSKASAQFFLDWVYQRARQIQIDDPQQRKAVLDYHRKARDYWQELVDKATFP
jgi:hypothetical protein